MSAIYFPTGHEGIVGKKKHHPFKFISAGFTAAMISVKCGCFFWVGLINNPVMTISFEDVPIIFAFE